MKKTMVKKQEQMFETITEEVAWSDGKVTKWRSRIEHKFGVKFWGDPKPSREEAEKSAEREVLHVAKAANDIIETLKLGEE